MLVAYAVELLFIVVFYLSQLTRLGASGRAYKNAVRKHQFPALAAHKKCTGGVGKRECSAIHERGQSAIETRRHDRAMEETTPSFLDAAIFFALSVAIGATGGSLSKGISVYEGRVVWCVSLLATAPLYTVFAFSSKILRRKCLRRNLISLAVILLTSGLIAPLLQRYHRRERWDVICFGSSYASVGTRDLVGYSIKAIVVILEWCRLLLWLIRLASKRCLPNWGFLIEMSAEVPWGQRSRRSYWQRALGFCKQYIYNWESQRASVWVIATCGLALAFYAAGSLAYEKIKIQSIASENYSEWEMAYGQYLAMLIWVPVLVEYIYVLTGKYTTTAAAATTTRYAAHT